MKEKRFDIALSFSGKDRRFVEALRTELARLGLSIFYDERYQASLAGEQLIEVLPAVYGEQCQVCVIVVSKDYLSSVWATLERRAALERALSVDGFVLPIRLDDTRIPGLSTTIGYLDTRRSELTTIANIIGLKILRQRVPSHVSEGLEIVKRQARGDIPLGSEESTSPGIAASNFWDFDFPLSEFRIAPEVVNGDTVTPIPIAQAHLYMVSCLVAHLPGRIAIHAVKLLDESKVHAATSDLLASYRTLSEYLRSWSFRGTVYSLEVSLLSPRLGFIGHPSARFRTSVYDIWSKNQIERMFRVSVGRHHVEQWYDGDDDRTLRSGEFASCAIHNQRAYFSWHDQIDSPSFGNRKMRESIGFLNSYYFSYNGPDAIIFCEVHIG